MVKTKGSRRVDCDRYFDPEHNPVDFVAYEALIHALNKKFKSPCRIEILDKDNYLLLLAEMKIGMNTEISEAILFECSGKIAFPLTCNLTDAEGQRHRIVFAEEEARSWMVAHRDQFEYVEDGVTNVKYSIEFQDFSPQVHVALSAMLLAARSKGLEVPFTVELRDARAEPDGDYCGGLELCNCSHLPFPVTIKLTDLNGAGFTQVVERPQ